MTRHETARRALGFRRRVVVAMSGGVDSSVVAALMRRDGHEVIGITLQLYDHGVAAGRAGSCCAGQDIRDARRVAEVLDIPHYVLDYERRFLNAVIQPFVDSYLSGETPVPCIACNQKIKFRDLLATARELDADVLATGHYVQRRDGPAGPELLRAADRERDQSYFLFATTREQLAHLWFPLGAMQKAEVRELAREFRLPVAEKADSQDICFVPSGHYSSVIARLDPRAFAGGEIVHVDGRVLGRHDGIANYTIGQRRGLKLACGVPLYVVGLDTAERRVVVGPRAALRVELIELRDVNWLGTAPLAEAARTGHGIFARIRSTQAPAPALLHYDPQRNRTWVVLLEGEYGVAPGQACVFYSAAEDGKVLGGGWITRADTPAAAVERSGVRQLRQATLA
jgi:tRNA-specific 2-thiouridylase